MLDCVMAFFADLHLHSRYAYACSKELNLANMAAWAKIKGIDLLSSGDFTHPAWLSELEENLTPVENEAYEFGGVRFVLGTELSCIFKQGGRSRRVHLLVFAPGFDAAHGQRDDDGWCPVATSGRPAIDQALHERLELQRAEGGLLDVVADRVGPRLR